MKPKTHIGYEVSQLEESIRFYTDILSAEIEFKNELRRCASIDVGGCEINLFERENFGGYHRSILRAMHVGFQCATRAAVDEVRFRAKAANFTIIAEPYERYDGDYSLLIEDPDGMQVEVFCGTHALERAGVAR